MDSLSQIVLGAAVGEAMLGRKLGNKAMLWGAVGGTIPDLDVIASPLLSEIDSLIFHRGISHSILFSVVGGAGFGWFIHRLHASKYYRNFFWAVLSLLVTCIPISICFFLFGQDDYRYYFAAAGVMLAGLIYFMIARRQPPKPIQEIDNPSLFQWQVMFFLAFVTHALLDCFTVYGTQLFLPFSDYRVAFSTIAVADPLGYTIPFLICLLVAMRFHKLEIKRQYWNWAGIVISSGYLLFTIWNKNHVFKEFDRQLTAQNISYDRHTLSPVIFSNLLWNITVENEDKFYHASYSIFDTSPIQFLPIEKNHHLIKDGTADRTIQTLKWFSNDFYNVMERPDGKIQFNDLRFGTFRQEGHVEDFIFRFHLIKEKEGQYTMQAAIGGPKEESLSNVFRDLFTRIGGR